MISELPPNFQEQMMNCELEFETELNETNIRKLIYVYTLGMQYYNIKGKKDFENYYRNKLKNLLLNDKVTNYLDTHQVDLTKKVDLNIFPEEKKETNTIKKQPENVTEIKIEPISTTEKSNLKNNDVVSKDDDKLKKSTSLDNHKKKNKINKQDILEYVTRKIKEVDIKLVSIDKEVSNNIVEQMSQFESNKRNKKVQKSKNSNDGNKIINELLKNDSIQSKPKEIEMPKPKKNMKRRGSSIGQTKLLKEIEEYVEQNMKEMYKALEELKQSYESEINEAIESGFEEIAETLKSDLKFEEENLTAQYEEERMKQIELIREKHKKS